MMLPQEFDRKVLFEMTHQVRLMVTKVFPDDKKRGKRVEEGKDVV